MSREDVPVLVGEVFGDELFTPSQATLSGSLHSPRVAHAGPQGEELVLVWGKK